ncbi:hypothetical protein M3Y96_00103200 [Aphelenchoides besseyi]|nr:hypothetical protein M3Y96_00103200 [Aphelenchoides besseyi]
MCFRVSTVDAETPTVFEKIAIPRPAISPLEKYKPSGIVPDKPSIEEKTKDSEPKTAVAVLCKDDTPTGVGQIILMEACFQTFLILSST